MKILIKQLQNEGQPQDSIFYFDLEDLDFLNIFNQGIDSVKNYINARTDYKDKIYLFVDEIQYLENASSFIKMPKIYFLDNGVLNYLKYNDIVEKISGDLFENVIFSELLKAFGYEKIKFWRTQAKNEIDFIVEVGKKISIIEVKKSYAGENLKDLNYFSNKYPGAAKIVITLDKKTTRKKDINVIYPWEISN